MKKWKQILSSALTAIILLGNTSIMYADYEQDSATTTAIQVSLYQDGASSAQRTAVTRAAVNRSAAEKAIYDGIMNCQSEIDLERFGIHEYESMDYVAHVINTSPELFYISPVLSVSSRYDGIIVSISPTYLATGTTLAQQRATYNSKMQEILNQVDSNWSDLEKILFLHDYLAQNYFYWQDPNRATDSNGFTIRDDTNYDAYSFLTEGHGVCQAYTLVYLALLKEVGINVSVADSEMMNHIWNLVQLDGEWYHVDVTWDDPVPDYYGNAEHDYLLLSDTAINRKNHYGWTADYQCTDTAYDYDCFWTQCSSPFKELDGKWYATGYSDEYYDDPCCYLYCVDFANRSYSAICALGLWNVPNSTSFLLTSCSGLGIYNDKVYFNTESSIISYDSSKTDWDAFDIVYTPSANKSLCGFAVQGASLQYELKTLTVSGQYIETSGDELRTIELPPREPSTPLSPGDMDGDGKITIADAFTALKYCVGASLMSNGQKTAADMNGDKYITLSDVQIILRLALHISTSVN